jgi:hypothetical protein
MDSLELESAERLAEVSVGLALGTTGSVSRITWFEEDPERSGKSGGGLGGVFAFATSSTTDIFARLGAGSVGSDALA